MSPQRRVSPQQARLERARVERANYIVSQAQADRDFVRGTLEAYEASERGEGKTLEQVRQEYGL